MATDDTARGDDSTTETASLREELAALRAENAALRAGGEQPATVTRDRPRRTWWRAVLSAVCLTLAGILLPVSIVAAWTQVQLVDETAFVDTFAPLADDPDVQNLVIGEATDAITQAVDIDSLTNDLFDGIQSLDLPPRAAAALDLLREPAAAGVTGLIGSTVTQVVQSDAFSDVWRQALTASHRSLVAAATGDDSATISIDDTGSVGIRLGPIIDQLKAALVERGFAFASAIPTIDTTIVLVQSDALLVVSTVYTLAVAVGVWVPYLALALLVAGVLVARRRSVGVLGAGVAVAVGGGVLAAALTGAGAVLGLNAGALGIPARTLDAIYVTIVGDMRDTALVFLLLGIVIALAGWLGGRSRSAGRVRELSGSLAASSRRSLQRRGLATGRTGVFLYRQRLLVRVALIVLAVAALLVLRPLSFGDVIGTTIVTLIVWWASDLLAVHPDDPGATARPSDAAERAASSDDAGLDRRA